MLINSEQAAALLGHKDKRSFNAYCRRGLFKTAVQIGGGWHAEQEELLAWKQGIKARNGKRPDYLLELQRELKERQISYYSPDLAFLCQRIRRGYKIDRMQHYYLKHEAAELLAAVIPILKQRYNRKDADIFEIPEEAG